MDELRRGEGIFVLIIWAISSTFLVLWETRFLGWSYSSFSLPFSIFGWLLHGAMSFICILYPELLWVPLSISHFLFLFHLATPYEIMQGCWYITIDTLSTLGSLFSSIAPYHIVRDLGCEETDSSLMDLVPMPGYLFGFFCLCNFIWSDCTLQPMRWEGQAYHSILPRSHSNIATCQGNVWVVSHLWVVEMQALPAPYYSEVWYQLLWVCSTPGILFQVCRMLIFQHWLLSLHWKVAWVPYPVF